jgi:hypothetical protein
MLQGSIRMSPGIGLTLNAAHSMLANLAIKKVPYLSSPVMLGIAALCDFVKETVLIEEARW